MLPVCKTINSQRQNVTVRPRTGRIITVISHPLQWVVNPLRNQKKKKKKKKKKKTVRPVPIPNLNISHVRLAAIVPPEISKIPARVQPLNKEHLNEQIERAKFKQLEKQYIKKQRFQQNNTRLSNTMQQVQQSPLNAPTRRFINSVQQRMQRISPQQMKKSVAMSVPALAEHNTCVANVDVEVNPSDCIQEKGQQPSLPRLEHENSSSESIAYFQKTINDPANTIVQHQIQGNTAKMLVMLATGEQRLITFDMPNEDCTVCDLLDKVNITFSSDTQVCLVDDPALGVNYIVDVGGSGLLSFENDNGDCNSTSEHLNEQFKQAKFKQLQNQHIKEQRFQQNNTQRLSNTLEQVQQSPLNAPTRRFINSVQQRMQRISPQQMKKSVAMSVSASAKHNTRVANVDVEVNPSDCIQEKGQQPSSSRLEHVNSSSESIAYFQKTINDPTNTIVQHQIQGNTAKMLVMFATGEQRLITFDMPNEDCTVCDLLNKVNITFSGDTQVCLVDDPALGVNYIVDVGGSGLLSFENDNGDCNSTSEHLNEQFKQAKFKQLQKQHIKKQRFQQNNTQRLSNTLEQVQQSPLNAPTRRFINSVQQRMQRISPQQMKKSVAMSVSALAKHNTRVANVDVEVNPSDCIQEKGQQPSSSRLEHENSSSESIAYFQTTINDPANTIVQHQIQWNTAKMLMTLDTGEERLITFDMPNEDCTVCDLLDQIRAVLGKVNITFSADTQVSFVNDALCINYIVDAGGSGLLSTSFENDNGDCNSTYEIASSTSYTENLSKNINVSDENSKNSLQTTEISL